MNRPTIPPFRYSERLNLKYALISSRIILEVNTESMYSVERSVCLVDQ